MDERLPDQPLPARVPHCRGAASAAGRGSGARPGPGRGGASVTRWQYGLRIVIAVVVLVLFGGWGPPVRAGRWWNALPVGRRVAQWRVRRNMTQQQFADRLGKSKSWVDKVERGVRRLEQVSNLRMVAETLRIDLEVLLAERPGGVGAAGPGRRRGGAGSWRRWPGITGRGAGPAARRGGVARPAGIMRS